MSSAMVDPQSGPINRAVIFHPGSADGPPAVEVAGVLVFTYLDDRGRLRVSLDFDTADRDVFVEDCVPVQIALNGQAVYRIDENGDEFFGDPARFYY